jgi:heat shock protein HtpX
MDVLEQGELRGVIAHELAHVQNRDLLVSTHGGGHRRHHRLTWGSSMVMSWTGGRDRNNGGLGAIGLHPATLSSYPLLPMFIRMAISRDPRILARTGEARKSLARRICLPVPS